MEKKDRELRLRVAGWICAVISWGAVLRFLWYLEKEVYGDALDIGDLTWMGVCLPLIALGYLIRDPDRPPRKRAGIWTVGLNNLVVYGCAAFLLWDWFNGDRYRAELYVLAVLGVLVFSMERVGERFRFRWNAPWAQGWVITAIFAVICGVTVLFCLITDPATVREGQQIAEAEGFTVEEYQYALSPEWVRSFEGLCGVTTRPVQPGEGVMGFYMYSGARSGEACDIIVSVFGHQVVGYTPYN